MNIQVGAGGVRLPGFLNIDIRKVAGVDIVADAGDLRMIDDGTVDVLFGHAVFEHFFIGHHLATLREWKRVLAPSGVVIMIGIPDFSAVAQLYLKGARGIVGERFDLFNVYRYTHGEPEHATPPVWPDWRATNGTAPPGWIPQLHKGLFDTQYLRDLLSETGLRGVIFNHAYPGEEHALSLGFIAAADRTPDASESEILKTLERVPDVQRFMQPNTIATNHSQGATDGLLEYARTLASRRPVPLSTRIANRLSRAWASVAGRNDRRATTRHAAIGNEKDEIIGDVR